jgi:hypothetical protein
LPSKHEALSSNSHTSERERKEARKEEKEKEEGKYWVLGWGMAQVVE